ncbi:hypothetical protein BS78_01G129600 [Paspalum vaginatum]|nr:hypothetical protein BS78_01G129600 [Paspalum vaginatum]
MRQRLLLVMWLHSCASFVAVHLRGSASLLPSTPAYASAPPSSTSTHAATHTSSGEEAAGSTGEAA